MNELYNLFAAWDLGSFISNLTTSIKGWGGGLIILIGVVMVIVAVFKVAKKLIMHGQGGGDQTPWWVVGALLILGGALMVGGFSFVANIAEGGKKTIEDAGNGTGGVGTVIVVDDVAQGVNLPLLR